MEQVLQIKSIEELKKQAMGEIIALPGWGDEPFVARVKRPSLLALMRFGKIPNALLASATKVFGEDGKLKADKKDDANELVSVDELMEIVVGEALAEPTYAELKENGIMLTDEQKTFIFNYTQTGVKELDSFRKIQADFANHQSSGKVQKTSKRNPSN